MHDASGGTLRERLQQAIGDRLEVGEPIGAGGFATVFRARDATLHRDVAIKVLDPALHLDAAASRELLEEARLVAAAEHPHIVPLHEAGSRDGLTYLVMRYFGDGTVAGLLGREGRLPPAEVARIGREAADALAAAHERGIVHLDVKPENLLVDGDRHVYVADFGIARVVRAGEPEAGGMTTGSPRYMSPEQVAGDTVDGRADVYALGLVLYELATGRPAIDGDTARQIMANQIRQAPRPIGALAPEVPAPLAAAITRALAKEPAARWQSAREMADALRTAGESALLVSPREVRSRRRRRWATRAGLVMAAGALAIVLAGVVLVRTLTMVSEGEPPAIDAWAPAIPAGMLDTVRAAGVDPATVRYVYAPHGRDMRAALLLTRDSLVVVRDGRARAWSMLDDADVRIDLRRQGDLGLLVVTEQRRADTVYVGMSGLEQQVLLLAIRRVTTRPDSATATPR